MAENRSPVTGTATTTWDLVVIGGGSAGIVGARTAAALGASVVLIENNRLGGDCLWTGCVPSKALIAAGRAAHASRASEQLGVRSSATRVDFGGVMTHVQSAIAAIAPTDSAESLIDDGVQVMTGTARFGGPQRLDVDGTPVRFRQALIATGAAPREPDIPGLDSALPLTSDTLWELRELPRRLLILGGGPVGCEIGQAMARLGSTVTIVQRSSRILPKENEQASALVSAALRRDGVDLATGRTAVEIVSVDGLAGTATLDDGRKIHYDRILVAVGRVANTRGLGLDAAGVSFDSIGNVLVDPRMRTTNPRIWAAGDVTPLPRYTHTAGANANIAVVNAVLGLSRGIDDTAVPHVTFTDPEIATVGESTPESATDDRSVVTWPHSHVDRAVAEGNTAGFTQLVLDSRGRIRGATIVGPRAGESLGELSLAVSKRLTAEDVARTTHAYPSYSDGAWNAAIEHYRTGATAGVSGVAARALRGIRRARLAIVGRA